MIPLRIACAISGKGRTLENLLRFSSTSECKFKVVGVISSSFKCPGLKHASQNHLPVFIDNFNSSLVEKRLDDWVNELEIDLVALCGFIKPFPILPKLTNKIINIHPSLLPKYGGKGMYGMAVHHAVIRQRELVSGVSIHFVTEEYDKGRIIAQAKVAVDDNDTPETLADKVFATESKLYPQVINSLALKELPLPLPQIRNYGFTLSEN